MAKKDGVRENPRQTKEQETWCTLEGKTGAEHAHRCGGEEHLEWSMLISRCFTSTTPCRSSIAATSRQTCQSTPTPRATRSPTRKGPRPADSLSPSSRHRA
eukprot:222103-Rhodomonas_salina.2